MPTLSQSLLNHDLGQLEIVAEHWGIELDALDAKDALPSLSEGILRKDLVLEILDILPDNVIESLQSVIESDGRVKWANFTRQFGMVRDFGAGRRDRERPDRNPISPAETLWYRAFIARAFFETDAGAVEFAYIPSDLLDLLPGKRTTKVFTEPKHAATDLDTLIESGFVPGRPASKSERNTIILADDQLVDDACTLIAGLRSEQDPAIHTGDRLLSDNRAGLKFLVSLLKISAIISENDLPDPQLSRDLLELTRGSALLKLSNTWLNSSKHNDLKMVPDLVAEGEWKNDALLTRRAIVRLIIAIPEDKWWSLSAFIADIHSNYADFQRPEGDYDSWYLKNKTTDEYLRGFENWHQVEGKLIDYFITGPLHWLGVTDLAISAGEISAFRITRLAAYLLKGKQPDFIDLSRSKVHVDSSASITVPKSSSAALRYQIARFCEWEERKRDDYIYRLTPESLSRARKQGLRIGQLLNILRRSAESVPPNLHRALSRWDERGADVRIQAATILRTSSKEMLQKLRSSRASRYLEDPVGPTTVIVKPGAIDKVLAILIELGYFGSVET